MGAVVIGGLISAITAFVCQLFESKRNQQLEKERSRKEAVQWNRTNKLEIYRKLAAALEGINTPIDPETRLVDGEEYRNKVNEFGKLVDENRGTIVLFVPNEIVSELYRLRGDIYRLSNDTDAQKIDFKSINDSFVMKAVQRAKHIENMLKKDLQAQ